MVMVTRRSQPPSGSTAVAADGDRKRLLGNLKQKIIDMVVVVNRQDFAARPCTHSEVQRPLAVVRIAIASARLLGWRGGDCRDE